MKGLVTKENQQFVEQLRIPLDATDIEIQDALCRIFERERERQQDRERGTGFSTEIRCRSRSEFIIRQSVLEFRLTAISMSELRVVRTRCKINFRSEVRNTTSCS